MMKRKHGTLTEWALAAGLPMAKAKKIVLADVDPSSGLPSNFLTYEEVMRRLEIRDRAILRRLLNLAQGIPIEERGIGNWLTSFIRPQWKGGKPISDKMAFRVVSRFVADLRNFIEGRGRWQVVFRNVSKTLTWEDVVTGSPSFYQSADWVSAFGLYVTELVDRYGNQIRKCVNAECGKLFLAEDVLRQKFCSPKCGADDRQRRFFDELANKGIKLSDYRRTQRQQRAEKERKKTAFKAEWGKGQ